MNKNFYTYKEPISSYDKVDIHQGILPPGRYQGFNRIVADGVGPGGSIYLKVQADPESHKYIDANGVQESGGSNIVVTKQGSTITLENDYSELRVLVQSHTNAIARVDAVVVESQYVFTPGDNLPNIIIVQGPSTGALPSVNGINQIVVAYIVVKTTPSLSMSDLELLPTVERMLGDTQSAIIGRDPKQSKGLIGEPDNYFDNLNGYKSQSTADLEIDSNGVLTIPRDARNNVVTVKTSDGSGGVAKELKKIVFEDMSSGLLPGIDLTLRFTGGGGVTVGDTSIMSAGSYPTGGIYIHGSGEENVPEVMLPKRPVYISSPGILVLKSICNEWDTNKNIWHIEGYDLVKSVVGHEGNLTENLDIGTSRLRNIIFNLNAVIGQVSKNVKKYIVENYDNGEIDPATVPGGETWLGKNVVLKLVKATSSTVSEFLGKLNFHKDLYMLGYRFMDSARNIYVKAITATADIITSANIQATYINAVEGLTSKHVELTEWAKAPFFQGMNAPYVAIYVNGQGQVVTTKGWHQVVTADIEVENDGVYKITLPTYSGPYVMIATASSLETNTPKIACVQRITSVNNYVRVLISNTNGTADIDGDAFNLLIYKG